MADNKDIENDLKQKSNITEKAPLTVNQWLNRIFYLLNFIALGLVIYQSVSFFKAYSKKDEEIFNQGRVISINTKTNEIALKDLTEEEISQRKSDMEKKGAILPDKGKKDEKDFVGPKLPEKKAGDDIIGPQPLDAEKKAQSPAEPPKPLDYNTANLGIVITEIGPKQSEIEEAKTLPKEVTFAFSPYSDDLQKKIDAILEDGRQVLLNIMLQPSSYPAKDNGPLSIQANYDETQNLTRFTSTIILARGYKGFLATNDEMVTTKFEKFAPILKKSSEKSFFIGYFKNTNNTNVENDAKPLAADVFGVDYVVDEDPSETAILAQLNDVKEDLVLKKRRIIIAIHPYPVSIRVLKKWLNENIGANIQIAPISYFVTNN